MKINKNYKVVNVYSGYGEFGVESIKVVKGSFIEEVCVKINKESLKSIMKGNKSKEDKVISYGFWDEFFNSIKVENKDLGVVGCGEENFYFVFGEGNKYYGKVEEWEKWSNEEWDEWVRYCNGELV